MSFALRGYQRNSRTGGFEGSLSRKSTGYRPRMPITAGSLSRFFTLARVPFEGPDVRTMQKCPLGRLGSSLFLAPASPDLRLVMQDHIQQ
jgi:hypothetical protein